MVDFEPKVDDFELKMGIFEVQIMLKNYSNTGIILGIQWLTITLGGDFKNLWNKNLDFLGLKWPILSQKTAYTVFVKICYFNYKVKINFRSEKIIDFDEKSGESENWVVLIQLK